MNRKLICVIGIILIVSAVVCLERSGESTSPENTGVSQTSALMVLDREVYHAGETATLTIINNGSETLLVGVAYRLYRLEGGKWREIPLGLTFTMIGYMIPPGGNWSQRIRLATKRESTVGTLEPLPPGKYRIEKTVLIYREGFRTGNDEITLSAEFEVVG
ncbi:immunoglobulin-like domain-containing protein [Thermococcus eurythermalis]|uniref:immunoglobulin-like domain-containing protein n=1 Tax=Thermococcus eurythermalis TaxID=1505907 RepID=UPI001186B085|nr:immunoglobulin-like domain-containing protein [Thermococcus eurythermalis]